MTLVGVHVLLVVLRIVVMDVRHAPLVVTIVGVHVQIVAILGAVVLVMYYATVRVKTVPHVAEDALGVTDVLVDVAEDAPVSVKMFVRVVLDHAVEVVMEHVKVVLEHVRHNAQTIVKPAVQEPAYLHAQMIAKHHVELIVQIVVGVLVVVMGVVHVVVVIHPAQTVVILVVVPVVILVVAIVVGHLVQQPVIILVNHNASAIVPVRHLPKFWRRL